MNLRLKLFFLRLLRNDVLACVYCNAIGIFDRNNYFKNELHSGKQMQKLHVATILQVLIIGAILVTIFW